MTWEIFGDASRDLAQMVADDGYEPDIILAIARGGLLIAGALGYALAVKNVYTMNVEFYTGCRRAARGADDPAAGARSRRSRATPRSSSPTTSPTPARRCELVKEFCDGKVAEVRCAVLYEKADLGRAVRVRVEAHRQVDQLPVERQGRRWSTTRTDVVNGSRLSLSERARTVSAQLRPLAPHTPAPGNVAAPVR